MNDLCSLCQEGVCLYSSHDSLARDEDEIHEAPNQGECSFEEESVSGMKHHANQC